MSEFFYTFWSLQLPFSRPTVFTQPNTLASFKEAVAAVMPVIKEATVKERAMMGSKAVIGTKRKREDVLPTLNTDDSTRSYVFAKFLTSPELLELEVISLVTFGCCHSVLIHRLPDCRYFIPSPSALPARYHPHPSASIHQGREREMGDLQESICADGIHIGA